MNNLIQITTSFADVVVVKLPEGILKSCVYNKQFVFDLGNGWEVKNAIDLPPGNWQYLGLTHEITEEQWRGIVPIDKSKPFKTYTEYGHSLLSHLGVSREENRILLKLKS